MLSVLPAIGIAGLLLFAAWRDVATRLIPNAVPLCIVLLGLALRAPAGPAAMLLSALVASLLFAVLLSLAMGGLLGGGDVKLAAAIAIGLPPAATWEFIFATTMVGGLLGLAYLARPRLAWATRPIGAPDLIGRVLAVEGRRLSRGGPLPYAVAIAVGAILVLATLGEG